MSDKPTLPDDFLTLHGSLSAQRRFSDRVYDDTQDVGELVQRMKSMVLGLQSETIELLNTVKFKDHVAYSNSVSRDKILYESVDVYRYLLAILNNWNITADEFVGACFSRDQHLHARKDLESRAWDGNAPVVVFDIDDVIGGFRQRFFEWIEETFDLELDQNSDQYYCTSELSQAGLNPEGVYERFIQESQVRSIPLIDSAASSIRLAKESGCFVQVLTARPGDNNRLCYDTYTWLQDHGLLSCIDSVAFSGEKLRWIMKREWYNTGYLVCAFEDSPKHASEYASHGITTFVPEMSYNTGLQGRNNIVFYEQLSVKSAKRVFEKVLKDL